MSKNIRIYLWILVIPLLIIIAFGITASFAADVPSGSSLKDPGCENGEPLEVDNTTTAKEMLEALNKGLNLTKISGTVKDQNPYIYCRERYRAIYTNALYELGDANKEVKVITLPGSEENGYAQAYVLAAPGYIKSDSSSKISKADERQWAWYFILGQNTGTANDLYYISMAYQDYKESEKDVKVTVDENADTIVSNNKAIYGPIQVEYSYSTITSGSKSDEWGGFYYLFLDENGTSISDKVKLCTKSNNTYTAINSTQVTTEGETKGYYQVKETTYNNLDLYILTTDTTISEVTLKIKENKVDYSATIHPIRGEYYASKGITVLCQDHQYYRDEAYTSIEKAIEAIYGGKEDVYFLDSDGKIYEYTGYTTEKLYSPLETTSVWDLFNFGSNSYSGTNIKKTGALADSYGWCKVCRKYDCGNSHINGGHRCGYHSNGYICTACQSTCSASNEWWFYYLSEAQSHVQKEHKSAAYQYTRRVYTCTQVTTPNCSVKESDKGGVCGYYGTSGWARSQGLYIIETATSNTSNEVKLDIDIQFSVTINVTKKWEDSENAAGLRSESITVKLLADGKDTGQTRTLNASNNWKDSFEELPPTKADGTKIVYSIQEISVMGYATEIKENVSHSFVITNTLKTVDVPVTKVWNDGAAGQRPESITVKLLADGKDTGKTLTLNSANNWKATFEDLPEYNKSGNIVKYTIEEITVDKYESIITGNQTSGYTITNTYYDGYIEITGKVWLDELDLKSNTRNGVCDDNETGISGIIVTLRDADGSIFDDTSEAITDSDGKYIIKVNYDNSKNVYKLYDDVETVREKIKTAYVEFEYNGMKYTTVATATTGADTSKAIEDEEQRTTFDSKYTTTTSSTDPSVWETETIKASTNGVISFENYSDTATGNRTETIRYCIGNGKHQYTNPNGAWNGVKQGTHTCNNCTNPLSTYDVEIEMIENVNLGLFERENPKVGLKADLTKVYVTMKGQSQGLEDQDQKYTYEYGEKSDDTKDVGLKAQFETKYSYEYMRPVNPADIAYIQQDANKDAMNVFVTYEIKVANLSNTLQVTVHNITNYFDNRYTLQTAGWTTTEGTEFTKSTYNGDLNITLQPQASSEGIELTYQVSIDAIRDLLNNKATLNHASEIESYSSKYGETTVYAEQRTGGRTGSAYAGYDYESHPGNAGMFINIETGKIDAAKYEKDTDIAPSFVLLMDEDEPKTLSGTVYEDTNVKTNGERVGDGKYDSTSEKTVKNVKVELYNLDGTLAKLYETPGSTEETDAIVYTDANGNYSFKGVVTGEYFIKFTYGENNTTIDGTTSINGRNYKSTIISEDSILKDLLKKEYSNFTPEEKIWHINIGDGYSVAVDNMLDRLAIEDLQNSNFDNEVNMTAYTKPFKTKVEFDVDETGNTDANGDVEGVSNNLNTLDFGIIERPREDLFVEKTITNIKLILANGQTLIEGDPRTQTLNYAKTMGFQQEITSGLAARNALPKRLLVEMDVELIQGSELYLDYAVKITNNNEIDYDYGNLADYGEILSEVTEGECDKYITKSDLANYYYFGEITGLTKIPSTIEMVDYLYGEMIYESDEWAVDNAEDLYTQGLISEKTYKEVKDNKYKIFKNASSSTITLAKGETWSQTMSVSKSLSNNDSNVYENSLEIIKIDSKTARTIQESDGGKQVEKSYIPGNYVPAKGKEQDCDIVEVILTPPTGIANYVITYLAAGLAGLIVIAVVVIFIKKKVLTK